MCRTLGHCQADSTKSKQIANVRSNGHGKSATRRRANCCAEDGSPAEAAA